MAEITENERNQKQGDPVKDRPEAEPCLGGGEPVRLCIKMIHENEQMVNTCEAIEI
ncbi:MAG: hypothetical protein R3D65_13605 [Zhengella sp.]|uniref:hypothetical protein n=1 Tax=Zhengella sp. TaxID=2282762 RepID=UPI003529BA8F|nr:hypothetical protein [Brucellaceae bacterium]